MILRRFHTCNILLREKPTNLKNKSHSSHQWLTRQLKDPYVEKARQEKFRCRSAFKLLEVNNKYKIFTPGMSVIDCGAAPGSWTQVAVKLTNADGNMLDEQKGTVIAIDRLPISPIEGAIILPNTDFTKKETHTLLTEVLNGKYVELVMSDMAPNATGMKNLDHEGIVKLAYSALEFALHVTTHDGTFLTKVWDGYMSQQLEKDIAKFYKRVKILRPDATRDESSEKFILGLHFKGLRVQKTMK